MNFKSLTKYFFVFFLLLVLANPSIAQKKRKKNQPTENVISWDSVVRLDFHFDRKDSIVFQCYKNQQVAKEYQTVYNIYDVNCIPVEFLFEGQYYPFINHIEPNGSFFLKEGHNFDSLGWFPGYTSTTFGKDNFTLDYVLKSEQADTIESYTSQLKYATDSTIYLYRELEYSFILKMFEEPILKNTKEKEVIRLTYYEYSFFGGYGETVNGFAPLAIVPYHMMKVFMFSDSATVIYKKGEFDEGGNFQITFNDSCVLKKNDFRYLLKNVSKTNFSLPISKCGFNSSPWLIEYKNGDSYYSYLRSCQYIENCDKTEISQAIDNLCILYFTISSFQHSRKYFNIPR